MNNKRTVLIIGMFLVVSLLVNLLLAACASPAPVTTVPKPTVTTAPTPVPSATQTPASTTTPTKVIELRYADFNAPQLPAAKIFQRWADMIGEQSGGRIKITCYFGETLCKQSEQYRAVQTGVADMGYYMLGRDPGLHDLNLVMNLPFLGVPNMKAGAAIYEALWNKFPALIQEFQGIKPLGARVSAPKQLHLTKKEVHVPQDLKGTKLITTSGYWVQVLKQLNAAAIQVPTGDWYMSLDKGLVEGHIMHFPAIYDWKTIDLLKYHTVFGESGIDVDPNAVLVNLNSWNSLPPDIQKIIKDVTDWRVAETGKIDTANIQTAMDYAKSKGQTLVYPTPDEMKLWQDAFKPLHDKWIADFASRGPTKEIYDEAKRLIQQYTK